MSEPTPAPEPAPRAALLPAARLPAALALVALFAAGGALYAAAQARALAARPDVDSMHVFSFLYAQNEPPALLVLGASCAALSLLLWRRRRTGTLAVEPAMPWVLGGAAALLLLARLGWTLVFHSTPLAMDEFAASFQARLFASGRLWATAPVPLRELGPALTPQIVSWLRDGRMIAPYLPAYAALRALFVVAGAEAWTNPVLTALSLLLCWRVALRLWPADPLRAALAPALLGLSSQLLINGMTAYAMPAHLCLNLLWLLLFLTPGPAAALLLPLTGVVAIGLHQPFPHALFAAPFFLLMLRRRQLARFLGTAGVYAAALAGFAAWLRFARPPIAGYTIFDLPALDSLALLGADAALFLSWQTPALVLCAAFALLGPRKLGAEERALVTGLALTFLFFLFFASDQGHGWGYRYAFSVLGNLALLGASGGAALAERFGARPLREALLASALISVLVQWPLRAVQAERFTRPFARAIKAVAAADAAFVVIDPASAWYARDLVRNEPTLRNRPLLLSSLPERMPRPLLERLRARTDVHVVSAGELAALGLTPFP